MRDSSTIQCPLCNDNVERLVYRYHLEGEKRVIEAIKSQNPGWTEMDGACSRCRDYYLTMMAMKQGIIPGIGPHFPVRSSDDFIILPTGLRLDADQRYTGKGVTICFIDSGFYPHPDLVQNKNRIREIIDISNQESSAWHGTMTSVVCAGDGWLSNGLYKGIACNAELVLLSVQDANGRVTTSNLVKAFEWIVANHRNYNIRIVNASVGGDDSGSYKLSEADRLAEQLVAEGVVVVAAAGNNEHGRLMSPANAPSVIAVGGFDDGNKLKASDVVLYHSTFGITEDELAKPELIAPAIWIAAPILPGSREQIESEALHKLLEVDDDLLLGELAQVRGVVDNDESLFHTNEPRVARQFILQRIQNAKYISPHYMHVDGTSFAAPIVSAVVSQLLEADPSLAPAMIREILFSTARRLEGFPATRQGFGVVKPRKALLQLLKTGGSMKPEGSPNINNQNKTIGFYLRHDCATQISLAGSFNHWAQDVLLMEPGRNGIWKIEIPMLPAGRYQYKFFVDDKLWLEDVNNPYREPDGFSGFNSILIIEN